MSSKSRLTQTRDKKSNDRIQKTILKSKIRKQALANIRKYTTQGNKHGNTIEADEGEHLLQYRQHSFKKAVSLKNKQQIYHLDLEFGEYVNDYSLNGRRLMLAGSLGHIAILDWKSKNLACEFNVQDEIKDCKFLHQNFVAIAQKQNTFIYDGTGLEIHQLTNIQEPIHLDYLPYHFLLASLTKRGKLSYTDVSTGTSVAEIKTKIQEVSLSVKEDEAESLQLPYRHCIQQRDSLLIHSQQFRSSHKAISPLGNCELF